MVLAELCGDFMFWTRPSSILKPCNECLSPSCYTLSNAILKSIKLWKSSLWCWRYFSIMMWHVKICSTELWRSLNPACSSAICSSASFFSVFRMTLSIILLKWLTKLIVM